MSLGHSSGTRAMMELISWKIIVTLGGFRKVDPDRWEFANEAFLGGQKHLLKTIKRRRNLTQTTQQQGGACLEIGQYGLEGDLERLRRDRHLLMTEIVKLRQQQQFSREQLITMEARIQSTEKKQQQMMTFLAKALSNPSFVQNLMQQNQKGKVFGGIEIGRKRRLTASPSTENFQEEVVSIAMEATQEQDELANLETDIENLFSAALDDESSSEIREPKVGPSSNPSASANLGNVGDMSWEELLSDDLIGGTLEEDEGFLGDQHEVDVPVEELMPKSSNWGEDLEDLIDQMGILRSKP